MITRRQFLSGVLTERKPEPGASEQSWRLVARIGKSCLAFDNTVCHVCVDVCVPAAIRLSPRIGGAPIPQVDNQKCSGCGVCVVPCPAQAITLVHPDATSR